MKRRIHIAISESLLNAIDRVRGPINRSSYIELLIRETAYFKPENDPGPPLQK